MCGIAGIYNYADPGRPVDRTLLCAMTARLSHRGPDADGFYVDGSIGLGHRRLSIVDLSPTGAQPMATSDHKAWIAYNGEFYNHLDYRQRLAGRGIVFRGSSDTETLLHVMRELGPDALEQASGIFGLAYWDAVQETLTLARDPLGVKQVYFYDDGQRVLFASEIKALLCDPDVARDIDPLAVSEYLHFHTPLFERTFLKTVRQVPAGHWVRFGRHRMQSRRYWAVTDFQKSLDTPAVQVERLREQLNIVVRDQLMADVPVAAFFSGGIDSTAVAAFAAQTGRLSDVFGVHFANQGVVDERPYQEEAAKALGLNLHLTTLDGASFASDLEKLLYFQDQPVIGPAMLPMHAVSHLAAKSFKVCLGGQASDEVFGGYARYALARPTAVLRNWFAAAGGHHHSVGGNLSKQLAQPKNIKRLARALRNFRDWQTRYFESFAKVPLPLWEALFDDRSMCDREHCRRLFQDETNLSGAVDPTDKIQEWDLRTYLTGLFQQDDRMSMSAGLESRVPLADPRLVRHAFKIPFDLKLRRGATKWILREAISDVVPESVLNRVKVGFDTPVDGWMKRQHADFVRETLLSSTARTRGIWSPAGLERLLNHPGSPFWTDLTWKALNIEVWAKLFLDTAPEPRETAALPYTIRRASEIAAKPETPHHAEGSAIPNLIREVKELGIGRTVARIAWEVKTRTQLTGNSELETGGFDITRGTIFRPSESTGPTLQTTLDRRQKADLRNQARDAAFGRLTSFGHWISDFGYPLAWNRNPVNGRGFRKTAHWSQMYGDQRYAGDIKLAWEAGRFPQCFAFGRAAALDPSMARDLCGAAGDQISHFIAANPLNKSVQWCNGQEVAFRLLAWTFAIDSMPIVLGADVARSIVESTQYVEDHLEYAQRSVYNNHLISEAFGLLLGGSLVPQHARASLWRSTGIRILEEEADKQFYADGAYISQSHNYQRSVLQIYLAAIRLLRNTGTAVPQSWLDALERSLDFLRAHQNTSDGRLPNYGGNDGAMPLILASCDYSDFRPTLQAASVITRGERLYGPGPWDELTVWLEGPEALRLPQRSETLKSVSFADTGYHVLRASDVDSFLAFRCGSLKDRFSQIDMLHVDAWWRGHNVVTDTGSFLYNGPSDWHAYFYGTAGHNTIRVNGHNQMPQIRKFKCLYPTEATLRSFVPETTQSAAATQVSSVCGEHLGYVRPFGVTHRRTILGDGGGTWLVIDDLEGAGSHQIELFWHGGEFPYQSKTQNEISLETPDGDFHIAVFGGAGQPLPAHIAFGEEDPPAGWTSRYYASKQPIPRLSVTQRIALPARLISILSPHRVSSLSASNGQLSVVFENGRRIDCPESNPQNAVVSPAVVHSGKESCDKELVRG